MITTKELYDLDHTMAGAYLAKYEYPFQALAGIKELIQELGAKLGEDYYRNHPGGLGTQGQLKIAPTAYLGAPCIIGAGTEVRPLRLLSAGAALVGENCVSAIR